MVNAYSNNYLENQVNSASPEQLLLMLYDGAIRFANMAIQSINDKNIEKRGYYINKTSAIIAELNATLDHDIGGDIAADLNRLYDFMLTELYKANKGNDIDKINVVIKLLSDLRETWQQAIVLKKKVEVPRSMNTEHKPFTAAM